MPPRKFGHINGVFVGDIFPSRNDLARAGVHRPNQAGISGSEKLGADSIVLSGGYEDDDDRDHEIIYTGEGGRDINTGKQVSDQFLSRRNLALAKSRDFELPVRVIRRVQGGYRYDGLYQVVDYWHETGKSGFMVWRFRLVKIEDYPISGKAEETQAIYGKSERVEVKTNRIIRDISISKEVKRLHKFRCQVCQARIEIATGPYAEAAHIQPLGRPHNGPDTLDNLLCLCPNHHVQFDRGGFSIKDNYELLGIDSQLKISPKHIINPAFLKYHREHYWLQK